MQMGRAKREASVPTVVLMTAHETGLATTLCEQPNAGSREGSVCRIGVSCNQTDYLNSQDVTPLRNSVRLHGENILNRTIERPNKARMHLRTLDQTSIKARLHDAGQCCSQLKGPLNPPLKLPLL